MLHSHTPLAQAQRKSVTKFPILLVFTLNILSPIILAQNTIDAQAHASRGISFARSRDWPEAEQELKAAVRAAPSVAVYHAQLGSILGMEGKWNESLTTFQKAVELDPANVSFRRETAAVQWHLGLMDAAEKNLDYILKKEPADPGATLLLGLVLDARGNYPDAARLLSSQFDLAVSQPDRTVALFDSLLRSGQKTDVGRIIEVLRLHTNDPLWTSAVGRCAKISAMNDDLETAETLFALIPDNDDSDQRVAGLELAALRYRSGQVAQAQQLLLQLNERGWVNADAQTLLGKCFESEHQAGFAAQAYSKAIEIDPSQIARYDDLISLQLESGKMNEAIAMAKRAVALAPKNARAWVLQGNVELRTNAYKEAIESYTRASKLDGSNADTILLIGGVHFIAGENDAAIAEYKRGIERFPNDPRFYIAYSEVLSGSPDSLELQARIEALLKKALQLAPHSAEAHYQLGQLALRQGRLQDAEDELLASLQSDPDRSKAHYALSLVYRRMGRTKEAGEQFAIYQNLKQAEEGATRVATVPAGMP